MKFKAKDIALLLNGTVEGNPEIEVWKPSKIEEGDEGSICFLGNLKYEDYLYLSKASIILVNNTFKPRQTVNCTLIRVENVYESVSKLLTTFEAMNKKNVEKESISKMAYIHPTAKIGQNVFIAEFVYIGAHAIISDGAQIYPQAYIGENAAIGQDTIIYAGVRIANQCIVGERCIIHSNAVIGSDGFGFAPQTDGRYKKIPQLGNVVIGNEVEIGANTTIDRATMGSTILENGVKLDNLIQIAHNVFIGENTVIAAQTGIAGSTKIGKNCVIGGQVGIVGHIQIANGTKIQAQSGVMSSIKEENTAIYGSPAIAYNQFLRSFAIFKNLPELQKELSQLQRKLKE